MSQSISKIQQQLYELEERLAELESINNILIHQLQQGQKLLEAAQSFKGITEPRQYFHQLKKYLVEQFNVNEFGVFTYSESRDILQLEFSHGVSQRNLKGFFYHPNEGGVGRAFSLNKMIYISDITQYADLSYYNVRGKVKGAVVYLPLVSHFGNPIAVLKLRRPLPKSFEESELNILLKLGEIFGVAWDTVLHIDHLAKGSFLDGDSGLFNRQFFEYYFPIEFKRAQRYQQPFSVVRMDIQLGKKRRRAFQQALPALIQNLVQFLEKHLRQGDVLIKYDVNSFLIMLPRSNRNKVKLFLKRLRELMHVEFLTDKDSQLALEFQLKISAVSFPEDTIEPEEMRYLLAHPEEIAVKF